MSKNAVFSLLKTRVQAESIVSELKTAGFRSDDISALFPDTHGTSDFAHEQNTKAPEGAVTGATSGGVLGGTLGLLVGIGALAIPGVGPLIAAGPLMAALSGAAVGAAVGGITGALIGMGIPEIEARKYEGKIQEGNILLAVHTTSGDQEDRAKAIFRRNGAEDVSVVSEAGVPEVDDTLRDPEVPATRPTFR